MFGRKTPKNKGKVFVGLSGGVDSAVSAALLKKERYEVVGVFIRIALEGYPCSAGQDKIEAMRAAAHLKLPFLEVDLSKEYKQEVFRAALRELSRGRTPNPDTLCNQKIKFGHFWEFAKARGADFIATGHYARTKDGQLFMGLDPNKDQSYFLWMVPQEVLRHTLFPVGGMHKQQVRALAEQLNLPNAARPDSQGLCFLGETTIEDMIKKELAPVPGALLNEAGEVVGAHQGAALYTLGQRHGFALRARTPAESAHFVIGKDIARNTVTVSSSPEPLHKTATEVNLIDTNWLGSFSGDCEGRFRYRGTLITARLDASKKIVTLERPQFIPEGQSLVLYQGERCLGGGVVDNSQLR